LSQDIRLLKWQAYPVDPFLMRRISGMLFIIEKEFVELEIADKPGVVGPPIDVLQISKTGVVWKQRKEDCK